MSLTEELLHAFEGFSGAHGQTEVSNQRMNGKQKAKSFIVRQPLTLELMQTMLMFLLFPMMVAVGQQIISKQMVHLVSQNYIIMVQKSLHQQHLVYKLQTHQQVLVQILNF